MILAYRANFRAWAEYNSIRCSEKKPWYTVQSYKKTGAFDSGTATSGTASTLTDNTKNWAVDIWKPGVVYIWRGTGAGKGRQVTGNTATTLTVSPNWIPADVPDATSEYEVVNTATFTQVNDVPNDNKSADATTPITWDLR